MRSEYLSRSVAPCPVGLVITAAGGRRNAMTVSFFSEVAHHPAALWVSVARMSYTHELIRESGVFSLAVLHDGQKELAMRCGTGSGRALDRWSGLGMQAGPEGFWYPAEALTVTSCRVRSETVLEDHTVFVADLLAGEVYANRANRRHLLTVDL